MSGCYVYIIHHATEVDAAGSPLVVYVGKGGGRRDKWWGRRNSDITYLVRSGQASKPVRISGGLTSEEAAAEEMRLIQFYGRADLGTGPLLNMSDGPGILNPSPQARARRSAWMMGRSLSPETIEKMAASHRGMTRSPEARARMSAAPRVRPRKPMSDEHRAKLAAAGRGRKHSPEAKAKMSAAKLGRVASAETRAKISAAKRGKPGRKPSAETFAIMSAAQIGRRAIAKRTATRTANRAAMLTSSQSQPMMTACP
jgi:hypothetical protein